MAEMKNDQYANIAAGGILTEGKGLEEATPPTIEKKIWAVCPGEKTYDFPYKMSNRDELYEELDKWKETYRPFLEKLAPELKQTEYKKELKSFMWKKETKEDRQDFPAVLEGRGEWEAVTLPHYGEPLGKAATYYRTAFPVAFTKDEAVLLCFRGVDYIAKVFVNGTFAGSHEGFFAPFQLDVTEYVRKGENDLVVKVENDFIHKRNEQEPGGTMYGGDKIYAATGPGYDDAKLGWHHCPPGMGIWQPVWVEVKKRCFIQDIFVRPLPEEEAAEAWVEIYKCDPGFQEVKLYLSLYGRNFAGTIFENLEYQPVTGCEVGLGDSLAKAKLQALGALQKPMLLTMEKGVNYLKIPFPIKGMKWWSPQTPYLYELQLELTDRSGNVLHSKAQSFGMRSFRMDTDKIPKGTFYLNGQEIKLRGANTMGHEQQCVIKNDMEQLVEDILLAKICNMNFLRLTQRPVQEEVYEYCDMLGMMTQTDLPLFGVLRIPQFVEALRQAEEMEKLVRKHPCNILVSYINEPFPNACNQPHRHLSRENLLRFFECADTIVKMHNPERVTKHVDGDYDPPSAALPDNHCYTLWYNGHGVEAGALHKGYWFPVKKDWNYGCGEFGAEGLDCLETMMKYYPPEWLPESENEEKSWSPSKIPAAQTGNFYYFFYDMPSSLEQWIQASQEHQARAAKWMAEAFRRDNRMVSMAIHLFIDAFPAGWMKAIMDVDRNPKPAYFAYRDALSPVMVSLRTDRFSYFSKETVSVEVWGCNDEAKNYHELQVCYEISCDEISCDEISITRSDAPGSRRVFGYGERKTDLAASQASYLGSIEFPAPAEECSVTIRAGIREMGKPFLHVNRITLDVKPDKSLPVPVNVCIIGKRGKAAALASELGLLRKELTETGAEDIFLVDEWQDYVDNKELICEIIAAGARIIFLELDAGNYQIKEIEFVVKESGMLPMNFVSGNTGHPLAAGFSKYAFGNWYDLEADRITPVISSTFTGAHIIPVLASGNMDEDEAWGPAMAVGEGRLGKGFVYICQIALAGRNRHNPAAKEFAVRLLSGETKGCLTPAEEGK